MNKIIYMESILYFLYFDTIPGIGLWGRTAMLNLKYLVKPTIMYTDTRTNIYPECIFFVLKFGECVIQLFTKSLKGTAKLAVVVDQMFGMV